MVLCTFNIQHKQAFEPLLQYIVFTATSNDLHHRLFKLTLQVLTKVNQKSKLAVEIKSKLIHSDLFNLGVEAAR